MSQPDTTNPMFRISEELICNSSANVFLTGKAGTGKTTFLKHIRTTCRKNLAVVAPTGVAAINAGGTTIHSFFQLPFGCFDYNQSPFFLGKLKINRQRRQVFRQLELLIIDEISMVRADLLDALDVVLKHFRYNYNEPFGGVQVLMIGDMYQLSPVVKDEEWSLISGNYNSPYFFDSRVMRSAPPTHIAFTKVYRQRDDRFVELLNKVRHNKLDAGSLQVLDTLYRPDFILDRDSTHIMLTTHNYKADVVNNQRLSELKSTSWKLTAEVKGEFNEKTFPTEAELQLKVGARVMFIKNDTEKVRRFFNGKIGTITDLNNDEVFVQCEDSSQAIKVLREKWTNIRYSVNNTTQQIEEEEIGSFTQFPLRLAWAVTIHKSQGLTFDKVVVDAADAFAAGQVYVALSRCTNLEGVVLTSKVPGQRLANDYRVVAFADTELPQDQMDAVVTDAKTQYQQKLSLHVFDMSLLQKEMNEAAELCHQHKKDFNEALWPALQNVQQQMEQLNDTGAKFKNYLVGQFANDMLPEDNGALQSRLIKAVAHFADGLQAILDALMSLPATTDSRQVAKEYNDDFKLLCTSISLKRHLIRAFAGGFNVEKYHEARNCFEAPAISINAYAAANKSVKTTLPHPQLYHQLKELRDAICQRTNAPVYLVASGKTLEELVTYLPQNITELRQIKGFGKVNTEKYGQQFLDIITTYCEANNVESNMDQLAPKRERKESGTKKEAKEPTWKVTLALYNEKKSVQETAKQRNLAVSTIEGHLATAVGHGLIDAHIFLPDDKLEKILAEKTHADDAGFNELMQRLGDGYSYFDLKVASQYKRLMEEKTASA